jgi:hypothetical protein
MTATLKSKQTSIATVRYHLLPVASLLTPLIFHYPLPLIKLSAVVVREKIKRSLLHKQSHLDCLIMERNFVSYTAWCLGGSGIRYIGHKKAPFYKECVAAIGKLH